MNATRERRRVGHSALPAAGDSAQHGRVDRNGLEVLAEDECLSLLATAWLGRIGLSIGALPAILPVAYAVDQRTVVFRTVAGSKLDAIGRGEVVCFEVDHADVDTSSGWSVLMVGRASEVTDATELAALDRLGIASWAVAADRYIRLDAAITSGRRVVRAAWPQPTALPRPPEFTRGTGPR